MGTDEALNGEEKRLSKKKEKPISRLTRLVQQAIGDEVELGHPEDQARVDWPVLWEWLSKIDAGREHVMEPGRITLSLQPTGVNVQLAHRGLAYVVEVFVPCLADVFPGLEAALTGPSPPIRQLGRGKEKIRKRTKK
jgi:hypothetical protein